MYFDHLSVYRKETMKFPERSAGHASAVGGPEICEKLQITRDYSITTHILWYLWVF